MFFLFYNFWRRLFFLLVDSKDYHVLCNAGYRKSVFFCFLFLIALLFKIIFLAIISLRLLFLLYAIIGLSCNAFFSLGLICNKYQCSSMYSLMFGRFLLSFGTSGILGLFGVFCFEVNKASFVTSDQ